MEFKKKKRKIVGENTSKIQKDKEGNPFALILENTSQMSKGDTIMVGGNRRIGGYIQGGDYDVKKISDKKFKLKE